MSVLEMVHVFSKPTCSVLVHDLEIVHVFSKPSCSVIAQDFIM